MTKPRGKGGNPGPKRDNAPNQGGQQRAGPSRPPPNVQPAPSVQAAPSAQAVPNFSDADAFGPPLGGGRRQNRNQAAASSSVPQAAPPSTFAWGAPRTQQPQPQPQPQQQQQQQQQQQPQQQQQQRRPPQQQAQAPQQQAQAPPQQQQRQAPPQQQQQQQQPQQPQPSQQQRQQQGAIPRVPRPSAAPDQRHGKEARGAIRGKPEESTEMLVMKPQHIQSKQGTSGIQMVVKANYFPLDSKISWQIFHYHVDFVPEIENVSFRNSLLVNQVKELGGFLYDRGSSIYTITQLPNERHEVSTRDRDGNDILIKIRRVGLISPLEHRSIQVINIIMKKAMKALNLQLVGRDHFDAVAKVDIKQHGIELWPGYTTSIRQHERSLLLMAEIKHKLMRTETLLDILRRCYNESRTNWQDNFTRQVLGLIVLTRYNNKTYRISDVLFDLTPETTFDTRDGPISYMDYYSIKRGLKITDRKQPLLRSTPTERDIRGARGRNEEVQVINLIPELCSPTGYTDDMRKNFNLMRDLAVHTRVGPAQRITKLLEFNNRLQQTDGSISCFRDWSLNLNRNLVSINARQLGGETIYLGGSRSVRAERGDWTNALQGRNSMYHSPVLSRWVAIVPQNIRKDADAFIRVLMEVAKGMNFNMEEPEFLYIADDRSTTLNAALEAKCAQNKRFILIAVSNNQAERYSSIKKVCAVRHAVASQVVTRRVMNSADMRRMRSVATKVAIQINSKNGGLPWWIDTKVNRCMYIGYDVCHDTRDKSRSYGAVVATMDLKQGSAEFFSAVSAHTNGEELSNNLSLNIIKAIKAFQRKEKCLPERILFYRDGVGEGQTNYVYQHELENLKKALEAYYGAQPVKLAFIIVSKRINTKFFLESRGNAAMNVPPGTVVDDVVTLPERYDFFIVSQAVNQGTATPTNYNVIYDKFGLPPDLLQQLTYKLCHLYYNWSGTTRVPALCQYAHKLAFLVGNYLHQQPADELGSYLYFL